MIKRDQIKREELLSKPSGMKRSLLLIGFIVCMYLIENSSIYAHVDSQIFNHMVMPFFWGGAVLALTTMEKVPPHGKVRLNSNIKWWSLNFGILFIFLLVVGGMIDGFGKSPYDHSLKNVFFNMVVLAATLTGRELIRSYLVNRLAPKENYFVFSLIALLMAVTAIPLNQFLGLKSTMGTIQFTAESLGPEFSHNLFATYLSYLGGPVPAIVYLGIKEGTYLLSPILPDLRWITSALIGMSYPIFALVTLQNIYGKAVGSIKRWIKNEEGPVRWLITCILSISMVWFAVGVFPYYPSVIVTGSMEPQIKPGDVIIVQKINPNDVAIGDVIQFRRGNILISHRVMEILTEDEGKLYQTKGDNNSVVDTELVKPEDIEGRIIYVVPKVGWPTLLMKDKGEVPLEEVVF